jgi:hypothetical protein
VDVTSALPSEKQGNAVTRGVRRVVFGGASPGIKDLDGDQIAKPRRFTIRGKPFGVMILRHNVNRLVWLFPGMFVCVSTGRKCADQQNK